MKKKDILIEFIKNEIIKQLNEAEKPKNKVATKRKNLLKEDSLQFNAHEILTDYDKAREWAINYSSIDLDGEEDEYDPDDYYINNNNERLYLDDLIINYMQIYDEYYLEDDIEIYRMLQLDNIKSLDVNNIGIFWSFKEDGVGVYGSVKNKGWGNFFTLKAYVNYNSIDWLQGFNSYLLYGEDQRECNLLKGKDVLITHINNKQLNKPIKGKS